MRPYVFWESLSIICLIVNAATLLVDPLILKWIIDDIIPNRDHRTLTLAVGLLLMSFICRLAMASLANRMMNHVKQKFAIQIRLKLLRHLDRLSAEFHDATPIGTTMYTIQNCVEDLSELSSDVVGVYAKVLLLLTGTLGAMLIIDFKLTFIVLPVVTIYFLALTHFSKELRQACETLQSQEALASSFLQEHVSSAIQIQLLVTTRFQARKAFRAWSTLARAGYARNRAELRYWFFSNLSIVTGISSIIYIAGLQVISGVLTIGGMVAFYRYLDRIFDPLAISVDLNTRLQRAMADIRRIRALLEREPVVRNARQPRQLLSRGEPPLISFEQISFSYKNRNPVIRNLDLQIKSGERVAIVGPSGSGKSTLARLLTRLYDVQEGVITLDGIDVRDISLETLRTEVTYVPQRSILFDATIEQNLRLGKNAATFEELCWAAEFAALTPVIARIPKRWEQPLGPSSGLLSGGERQRIAIARALLRKPRILILDESTGEVDSTSENKILRGFSSPQWRSTLLIITHRLSAITWVDRIIVLVGGSIVATGTHDTLLETSSVYKSLFEDQQREQASDTAREAEFGKA
jgi:ATP-binding cassette, subfamily B, bacterial MsbA